jgi:hypothetical protein
MAHTREYFASGILKDGRVFAIGGEDSDAGGEIERFDSRDAGIEELAQRAWEDRLRVRVLVEAHEPHRPASLAFLA